MGKVARSEQCAVCGDTGRVGDAECFACDRPVERMSGVVVNSGIPFVELVRMITNDVQRTLGLKKDEADLVALVLSKHLSELMLDLMKAWSESDEQRSGADMHQEERKSE